VTRQEEAAPSTSAGSPVPRLLVLAPLRIEELVLRPGGRLGPARLDVEHIGMGPSRARKAARRLSSGPPPVAVAVTGLGGALGDNLEPGDLVVGELLIDPDGNEVSRLASAPLLAAELRRLGLRARPGIIVSADHIVTGAERAMLSALGADVVDMESTAVAGAPWEAPLAVVRAISDTPGQELFSPAGVAGALTALRALRASRRALANWAAAAGSTASTGAGSNKDPAVFLAAPPSPGSTAPDETVHLPPPLEVY
jgi:4-hydroxy-3-methylbut-2-en-1-yl diphosphate reductase